ncbi:MAG TPA: ShlB/FhaC/HecB family hemolysin secretion/activation protein [Chthoniobacteraceae bacterium]|nr:ShlB/FhaC/HecB family hemolysin secretion/activation protein [Chthoniobacteraceae bacterium]
MRASRAGKGPVCGFQNKIAVLTAVFVTLAVAEIHAAPSPLPSPAASSTTVKIVTAATQPGVPDQSGTATPPPEPSFYIAEYRVKGVHKLTTLEVEQAVYPFLGPERTKDDVEKARAALQSAYQAKGFASVSVVVPPQRPSHGVIMLEAVERTVGQLRVNGAKYFSPDDIKKQIPSLAPGTVPDLSEGGPVQRDLTALNQLPDRRVTVSSDGLKTGLAPGTVDIDLTVQDKAPVHGSIELNNRYSANTSPLRVNGSLSDSNLWQAGQGAGVSFQLAPQHLPDGEVYSAYYIARFPDVNWLSLMLLGTKQNSNVSSLGGSDVVGKGETVALLGIISLPSITKDPAHGYGFYESLTVGFNFKHYDQNLMLSGSNIETPVTYYPLTADYNANWVDKGNSTEADLSLTANLRGAGSTLSELDNSRFNAGGNFIYVHGELAHTQDLPQGFQAYAKIQGQLADQPLLNSEQISGGGLSTVRGYLESAVLGDKGIFASGELRTPPLNTWTHGKMQDWRFYGFTDWGMVAVIDPLPGQQQEFTLASFGFGTRMKLLDDLNGSLDLAFPLISQGITRPYDPRITFRVWAQF